MQKQTSHDPEAAALSRAYSILLKLAQERKQKTAVPKPENKNAAGGQANGNQK